jgi:hypothetical protein
MNQILPLAFFALSIITGCSIIDGEKENTNVCSNNWYELVEKQVLTVDNHGHGPDIGSTEWRSVVEFKLGIRGNKKIPPIKSEDWCNYINNIYIKKAT